MTKLNIGTLAVAVVALVAALFGGKPSIVNQTLGSVSGPDAFFPCESHNGLTTCTERQFFRTSSTTLASFRSPSATSTLRYAAGSITTATTSATQFEWGRATVPDATTTTLGIYNLAASVKAMVLASTTATFATAAQTIDQSFIIPPNTYVNFKFGGQCTTGQTCSSIGGYAIVEFRY